MIIHGKETSQVKVKAFYECYPMVTDIEKDPTAYSIWSTFSHIWDKAVDTFVDTFEAELHKKIKKFEENNIC